LVVGYGAWLGSLASHSSTPQYISTFPTSYMKRTTLLLFLVLISISVLSGFLTSNISLLGNVGIGFFYKKLSFFKTWWQSALVCLALQFMLVLIIHYIGKQWSGGLQKIVLSLVFILLLTGFYFTYQDFNNDLAHQLMGNKFHTGIYLYWIGACVTCLFYLFPKRKASKIHES